MIRNIDSKLELSKIKRFPIKMRNIESSSDLFRPKFSVKKVKAIKDMIIAMNTKVEKKMSSDLYSQRKSTDAKELANEVNGY